MEQEEGGDVREGGGAQGRGVAAEEGGEAGLKARDARLRRFG